MLAFVIARSTYKKCLAIARTRTYRSSVLFQRIKSPYSFWKTDHLGNFIHQCIYVLAIVTAYMDEEATRKIEQYMYSHRYNYGSHDNNKKTHAGLMQQQ